MVGLRVARFLRFRQARHVCASISHVSALESLVLRCDPRWGRLSFSRCDARVVKIQSGWGKIARDTVRKQLASRGGFRDTRAHTSQGWKATSCDRRDCKVLAM
jgi:hypothetical protein